MDRPQGGRLRRLPFFVSRAFSLLPEPNPRSRPERTGARAVTLSLSVLPLLRRSPFVSVDALQQKVTELAEPICAAHGVELVEVRLLRGKGGVTFRIILDRERPASDPTPGSGVTLEDCTGVSRDLSTALDLHEDDMPERYQLEVSSPGLERPLTKPKDFERFAGREIQVKTHEKVASRRSFRGQLLGVEGGAALIDQDGAPIRIPFDAIARATLVHRYQG
jgi:ribosome maturation factor RimP